jgi:thioredoxin 1
MGSVCAISLYLYFLTKGDEELSAIESCFQLFQNLRCEWSFLVQVVLDISTKTCGPCKMIFPKVVQLSIEYPDVVFLKINGDTNTDTRALMRKWGVRAVPNFRFFRNGELVHSHTGAKLDVLKAHFATHYTATIKT